MNVMFKGTMTKWPVQKLAQRTTQKLLQHFDATDISKTYTFVFFGIFKNRQIFTKLYIQNQQFVLKGISLIYVCFIFRTNNR